MTTNEQNNNERSHEETLAYHKALLKQMNWVSLKGKAPVLPLPSLGRGIHKIVRTLNPIKPTFLKLGPRTEVVFLTKNQYKSLQELKLAYARIIAEEESNLADADKKIDELAVSVKPGLTDSNLD